MEKLIRGNDKSFFTGLLLFWNNGPRINGFVVVDVFVVTVIEDVSVQLQYLSCGCVYE